MRLSESSKVTLLVIILRVIRTLGDIWRECIHCTLRRGRDMTKEILRRQVQNIEKKKLLLDLEIGEMYICVCVGGVGGGVGVGVMRLMVI